MAYCGKRRGLAALPALVVTLAGLSPALATEPQPAPNGWQFSFTPYAWATAINGDATVRGHTADINESFIDIVEKSDSLLAWMSYFEARKGPLAIFTDVVWADLGFPAHKTFDFNRSTTNRPFAKFPNVVVSVDANLDAKANAQADYESTIIQSGAGFEVAKWSGPASHTALDVLGGARYWNQELDLTFSASGTLTVDVTAEATIDPRDILRRVLKNRGFELNRRGAKLLERVIDRRFGPGGEQTIARTVQIEVSRALAIARSGDLEWVDPFIGGRIRHQFGDDKEINLEADVGGFGVGSDFSWQVVATYGFDVKCLGTPLHTVIGYRALAVDYSENGRFGKNGLDFVEHGPVMGVKIRW
jgi:hypothetical protein